MRGVNAEEIRKMKEKVFLIYNKHRTESETDKLGRVKKALNELHTGYNWTVVRVMHVANSIAYHKFYTYRIKCKYVISLSGYKC